nr:AAA family ATPase [Deinobacterium chartae]
MLQAVARGATPPLEAYLEALPEFDLLDRLRGTEQDPVWHAEGDVFEHTARVLACVYAGFGEQDSLHDRLSLALGAVLHDIAKPLVTRRDLVGGRERVVAPRHADRGRSYAAPRLLELGLPREVFVRVLSMIGHHHDPRKLVEDGAPEHRLRRLARLARPSDLYRLGRADLEGRVCPDLEAQLDTLELFRMACEDLDVWEGDPYHELRALLRAELPRLSPRACDHAFARGILDLEEGTVRSPYEVLARARARSGPLAHLYLTCGPSGSGKSAWTRERFPEATVVSLDQLRAELGRGRSDHGHEGQVLQEARRRLRTALARSETVVWEATGLTRARRAALFGLARDYGALVTQAVFEVPPSEAARRNFDREHAVHPAVLEAQLRSWEWPYADEAHLTESVDPYGKTLALEGGL